MYEVKFYLLHGWRKVKKNGKNGITDYVQDTVSVQHLSDTIIHKYKTAGFKVDSIDVIYGYNDNEGDSND